MAKATVQVNHNKKAKTIKKTTKRSDVNKNSKDIKYTIVRLSRIPDGLDNHGDTVLSLAMPNRITTDSRDASSKIQRSQLWRCEPGRLE